MELNDLEQQRVEKMKILREGGMEPYPRRIHRTHTTKAACEALEDAPSEGHRHRTFS